MFFRGLISRQFQQLQQQQQRPFHSTLKMNDFSSFFDNSKGWSWNEKELLTGRAWNSTELRQKDFNDLHTLWWNCLKEKNKLESQKQEARRFKLYFPHGQRTAQVRITMARIKQVLWERRMAWLQAQEIYKQQESSQESLDSKSEHEISSNANDQQDENSSSIQSIARMGRRNAPIVRQNRIKTKKVKRATTWSVV